MTEPQAGSDPQQFTTAAIRDGDEWIINGMEVLLVMPARQPSSSSWPSPTPRSASTKGHSMFLVPTDTPGVIMSRHVGLAGESEDEGMHELRFIMTT